MPQYARPSADVANPGNWTTHTGGTTNLYTAIDEVTPDHTDFIQSPLSPSSAVYVVKLSSVVNPNTTSGHILRFSYSASENNQQTIQLTVQLRQGYVNESNQGTLIAQRVVTSNSTSFVTDVYTLSSSEAGAITNYGDLYLRMVASAV